MYTPSSADWVSGQHNATLTPASMVRIPGAKQHEIYDLDLMDKPHPDEYKHQVSGG